MNKSILRIGVDARELQYGMGGIARFLLNMLRILSETGHDIVLFTNNRDGLEGLNFEVVTIPHSGIPLFEDQALLCGAVRRAKLDLFLSPYYKVPLFIDCKGIITIHDLTVFKVPFLSPAFRLYLKIMVYIYALKAERIFTDSECSKNDILQYTGLGSGKVSVVYTTVPDKYKQANGFDCGKYDIAHPFILYVGNLCPHKNLKTLLRAYAAMGDDMKGKYRLVVVGKTRGIIGRSDQEAQYLELTGMARDLGISDKLHFVEFVEEEDLPGIYSSASLLVLPSYYEGFGLPAVEAMACGCPVIVSDRSSLPEITGDAAVLFNPDDHKGLAEKMGLVLTDDALKADLIAKGAARAGFFRHDKIKNIVIEAIESIRRKRTEGD
ncbi:MAG: glycosyltransferase family 4 protein [Deltaproteobacteria bacterium]|nr:glycosyltransferase family 4 protein [Deltaproteobacteria bacterium]